MLSEVGLSGNVLELGDDPLKSHPDTFARRLAVDDVHEGHSVFVLFWIGGVHEVVFDEDVASVFDNGWIDEESVVEVVVVMKVVPETL